MSWPIAKRGARIRYRPAPGYLTLVCGLFLWLMPGFAFQAAAQTDTEQASRQAKISFIISQLERQQQIAQQDPVFLTGSYPSYIHHRRHFKKKNKDITLFYNILIDLSLKNLRPALEDSLKIRVDTLMARSSRLYPRFYNASRGTYNFWLRDSSYRFPYSWWIPIVKKDGAVPDDMDDTVLSRMVAPNGNKDTLEALHQLMQSFTVQPEGKPRAKLRTIPRSYRHYNTYSTWFGERFPVVIDAVVLSNILSFVCHYDLNWTAADSAALKMIVQTIKSRDYLDRPLAVAPYYGKSAILLYHYSRLMQQKHLPALDSLRPLLIASCHELLAGNGGKNKPDPVESLILAGALIQLGEEAPAIPLPDSAHWQRQVEHSDFPYFIGNIPSYMSRGLQGILIPINAMMYYHYCPALNDVLALQYLIGQSFKD